MKKIINDPFAFVDEMLEGIILAHPDKLKLVGADRRAGVRADAPITGKVGIATGGGSGHLPVFMGYVGKGFVDGCSIGNVFSSPTVEQMVAATQAIDGVAGVLYLFGNYQGDVLNFGMAAEMADAEGIKVETVLAADDVASTPKGEEARRRGVAGIFYQLYLDIDRTKAESLQVPLDRVFETLSGYLGSSFVNLFNKFNQVYQVYIQADARYRLEPKDINNLYVSNTRGEMVPLGSLLQVKRSEGSELITRYNLYPAAAIYGAAAPGFSSGQGLSLMEQAAANTLPQGMSYEWTSTSYQEKQVGHQAYFIYALSIPLVFMVVAALYETIVPKSK